MGEESSALKKKQTPVTHRAAQKNSFITDQKNTQEGARGWVGGGVVARIPLSRAASIRFVKSVSFPASESETSLSSTSRKLKGNQSGSLR